jgi:hypothetical protein
MSLRDQKKYLDELKRHENKMTREELDAYKIMLKRHKDEEDFDSVTMKKLKGVYDKYYKPGDRSKLDDLFKKKD